MALRQCDFELKCRAPNCVAMNDFNDMVGRTEMCEIGGTEVCRSALCNTELCDAK
jgi:hypothetical protein